MFALKHARYPGQSFKLHPVWGNAQISQPARRTLALSKQLWKNPMKTDTQLQRDVIEELGWDAAINGNRQAAQYVT